MGDRKRGDEVEDEFELSECTICGVKGCTPACHMTEDDLNACYGRPPIKWKTPFVWTDAPDAYPIDDLHACHQCEFIPVAPSPDVERPPIKSFVKEAGEPAVQISGEPDPEGLKKFDEKMRTFDTGATRDTEEGKNDYVGFLSPLVIEAFGDYMTRHRVQADGSLRDSDNWKLGQPKSVYIKSAFRHFLDLWKEHCGYASRDGMDEALGGLLFNIMGYWLEYLREREVK